MIMHRLVLTLSCALGLSVPIVGHAQVTQPADSGNIVLATRLLQAMHYDQSVLTGLEAGINMQRGRAQLAPVFYDSALARMRRTIPQMLDSVARSMRLG